jgi:hypothetical protein
MPSRSIILAIVVFWLATTGWLIYRDLRLRLLPGEPPPYTIDLADEAEMSTIRWSVFRDDNPKQTGYAKTKVRYNEADDMFEISGEFKFWSSGIMQGSADMVFEGLYSVTREGRLRAVDASATLFQATDARTTLLKGADALGKARIEGTVQDRRFKPHLTLDVRGVLHLERDLPIVEVSERGNVLNPLQPVNRLGGLRKGQHWRMPLVHPLSDALSAAVSSLLKQEVAGVSSLDAEVLPETHVLEWGHTLVPCLVVEFTGEDVRVRTWVRESDGTVLRQEVEQHGEKLALQRDY